MIQYDTIQYGETRPRTSHSSPCAGSRDRTSSPSGLTTVKRNLPRPSSAGVCGSATPRWAARA
eukprot:645170-Pyramimonas_sp.AAC.2